ncbi:MAG: hypothetical protein ACTSUE_13875 [Promethearchaeota archaeon]
MQSQGQTNFPYFNGQQAYRPSSQSMLDKNAGDRFFHAKPNREALNAMELFFGTPEGGVETGLTSQWQTRGDWPAAYTKRNVIESTRMVWGLADLQAMHNWVTTIAPTLYSNMLSVTIRRKIYSDDIAEFIGLSAPPTEVASYVMEKTESGAYIGKGTSIHANMLSSPEGRRELHDKFMQIGVSIIKSEMFDFIEQIRMRDYAQKESAKIEGAKTPRHFFERNNYVFDIVRKEKNGIQKISQIVRDLADNWHGELEHMIVPQTLISKLKFKDENTDYYIAGRNKKYPFNQLEKPIAHRNYDKVNVMEDINGFKVHVIRRLMSTSQDLYQHVLARFTQIGSFHWLCNYRDKSFHHPNNFKSSDLTAQVYNEERDDYSDIDFEKCLEHSMLFDEKGDLRPITTRTRGSSRNTKDIAFDPFVKGGAQHTPIQLIGEMNVREEYLEQPWEKMIDYIAQTMNNHFARENNNITENDIREFRELFATLERIEYDEGRLSRFLEANYQTEAFPTINLQSTHYKVALPPGTTKRILKQVPNTGFYNLGLVGRDGKEQFELMFGMANYWGVEMLARLRNDARMMDQTLRLANIAYKFVAAMELHTQWLRRNLPRCRFLQYVKEYSPAIFTYPKEEYNTYINTIHNATYFLCVKQNAYAGLQLSTPSANLSTTAKRFFSNIKVNTTPVPHFNQGRPFALDTRVSPDERRSTSELNNFIEQKTDLANDRYAGVFLERLKKYGYFNYVALSVTRPAPGNDDADTTRKEHLQRIFDTNVDFEYTPINAVFQNVAKGGGNLGDALAAAANVKWNLPKMLFINITTAVQEKLGGVLQEANGPMNQFLVALNRVSPDLYNTYVREMNLIKNQFFIFYNSMKVASELMSAQTGDSIRTTLTLNPYLRQSIVSRGGSSHVRGTSYAPKGRQEYQETEVLIKETGTGVEPTNSRSFMDPGTRDPIEPFHSMWSMLNTRAGSDTSVFGSMVYNRNIHGKTEDTYKAACRLHPSRLFVKSSIITLCLSDFHKKNIKGMHSGGACPVIEYLLARPHMEYMTFPIIYIGGNGKAARMLRGNPLFTMGMNAKQGIINFRFAQSMGTFVTNEGNIYIQENAHVADSMGGSGVKFYQPNEYVAAQKKYYDARKGVFGGKDGDCSMFAIEVPTGFFRKSPSHLDLNGHYYMMLDAKASYKYASGAPLFPTAYRFVKFYDISKFSSEGKPVNKGFSIPNYLCSVGTTMYNDSNNEYTIKVSSQTSWGDQCSQPGSAKFRSGKASSPPPLRN